VDRGANSEVAQEEIVKKKKTRQFQKQRESGEKGNVFKQRKEENYGGWIGGGKNAANLVA